MSVTLWAYKPIACDDEFCGGDCDICSHRPGEWEKLQNEEENAIPDKAIQRSETES